MENEINYQAEPGTDKIEQEDLEELIYNTWLSQREAEIYLMRKNTDLNMREIAEELGVKPDTLYGYWRKAKNKVTKSEATTELGINTV